MSLTRQRPPGVGPPNGHETTTWVPGRPLWQQFLIGAVGVLLVVGAILVVLRMWAIPALQARGSDTGIAGEATLAALQTQQAIVPRPTAVAASGVAERTPVPTRVPTPIPAAARAAAAATPMSTVTTFVTTTESGAVATPAPTTATPGPSANSTSSAVSGAPIAAPPATAAELPVTCPDLPAGVDAALVQELFQAYQVYWARRTLAYEQLDAGPLAEVATGKELTGATDDIDELRAQGRAIEAHVIHHICILAATSQQAVISDEYEDRSVFIDATTRIPLKPRKSPSDPAPIVKVRKLLQTMSGVWKVAGGELYD